MEDEQNTLTQRERPPLVRQGTSMRKMWHSCCCAGGTEKQLLVYSGQLVFAFTILAFSFFQLHEANGSCERSSPYIGLISFLMGKLLATVVDSNTQAQ